MGRKKKNKPPTLRSDLAILTKLNLNTFVVLTNFFGFLLGSRYLHDGDWIFDGWLLFHTILGTACTAFGSAAFNQLMEIEEDARMERTADRPLPARRMIPVNAFGIGWALAAFGIIHLAIKVNPSSAYLAAAALGTYVFLYTPLKRTSSTNTLMGGIPGAIPPMIGWAAAGGNVFDERSWFLFAVLFLWQMPHFIAINWLCREEYEDAGYVMWANGDVSGKFSSRLSVLFSWAIAALGPFAYLRGYCDLTFAIGGTLAGIYMVILAMKFGKAGDRPAARKLFLYTLLYLPIGLTLLAVSWNSLTQ
ncbi:heme o synthase [Persicirhabdus sediminis]|uniref:Protoheme IX farnesyltransferase n=1 Tax=Persicirhabdus sediminis TaxID=454144 RepID=A0A8J7MB46_9BACT|nr:heme o synthase [Persicirhabdus sediminis]MBK1789741.1 protoheme IX farnesyltransferase [Persicirhabdus sediminis]